MYAPGKNGKGYTQAQQDYRCGFYDAKHGRPWAGQDYSPRRRDNYTKGYDGGIVASRRGRSMSLKWDDTPSDLPRNLLDDALAVLAGIVFGIVFSLIVWGLLR